MEQDTIAETGQSTDQIDAAEEFRRLQEKYQSQNADDLIRHIESLQNGSHNETAEARFDELNETIERTTRRAVRGKRRTRAAHQLFERRGHH